MQGWRDDERFSGFKTASTLEELLPKIKKSLADPQVTCVMIFNAHGSKRIEVIEYLNSLYKIDIPKKWKEK